MKRQSTIVKEINKMFPPASTNPNHPICFIMDEQVKLSAEGYAKVKCGGEDFESPVADYYGEFRGGYPWIEPKLKAYAERNGMYWEWENPGRLCLVSA